MSQPSPEPQAVPPAFPTPPDPDRTVAHAAAPQAGPSGAEPTVPQQAVPQSTSADPTVPHPVAQHAPQPYAPGQAPPQYPANAPVPPQYGMPQGSPGYPASAPPYTGQPMSAPPMSAPPVSGPGYGPPMSAPPVSGPGYGPPYGPPGAQAAGRGRAVLVLALVAALLFVVSGVMTGLFVTKNNELNRTEKRLTGQVSERDGTIAANATEITRLKADLGTMQAKLDNTEQDLTGTRNDRDEQARQKTVIASCLDKLTTALGAASAGNKAAYDAAMKGLDKVCDEAENYL
ncbi:hypothetical protein ACGFIP_13995 [Micromonospora zamorensis]|uniref:hypothetical protein n=1 Tax=Micromonospora zamorensis TaxID=709883 RepID=UPI00371F8C78